MRLSITRDARGARDTTGRRHLCDTARSRSVAAPAGIRAGLQEATQSVDLLAVRRVLDTESPGLAAARLTYEDLHALERILSDIDAGITTGDLGPESSIDADAAFHRRIAAASGNPPLRPSSTPS